MVIYCKEIYGYNLLNKGKRAIKFCFTLSLNTVDKIHSYSVSNLNILAQCVCHYFPHDLNTCLEQTVFSKQLHPVQTLNIIYYLQRKDIIPYNSTKTPFCIKYLDVLYFYSVRMCVLLINLISLATKYKTYFSKIIFQYVIEYKHVIPQA